MQYDNHAPPDLSICETLMNLALPGNPSQQDYLDYVRKLNPKNKQDCAILTYMFKNLEFFNIRVEIGKILYYS